MFHILSHKRRITTMILLMMIFAQITPTPAPVAAQDLGDAKSILTLTQNVTGLGVVALAIVFGILFLRYLSNSRGGDSRIITEVVKQSEENRKEVAELKTELQMIKNQQNNKLTEGVEAIAISNKQIKDVVIALNDRDIKGNDYMKLLNETLTSGSPPVQRIENHVKAMATDGIKPDGSTRDQLSRIESATTQLIAQTSNIDMLVILGEIKTIVGKLKKDTKELPAVEKFADVKVETDNGGAAAA